MAISFNEFVKQSGGTTKDVEVLDKNNIATPVVQKQGILQETGQDIKQIGSDIAQSTGNRADKVQGALNAGVRGEQGALRTTAQVIGQGAGLASDVIGNIFKGVVKAALPQQAETAVKKGIGAVAKPIVESQVVKNVISKYNSLDEKTKRDIDAALGVASLAGDVAGIAGGVKAGKAAVEQGVNIAKKGVGAAEDLYGASRTATSNIVEKLKPPKPTPTQAVKNVVQGTTKDFKAGVQGLSSLDTQGVKTYKDLGSKITSKITELSQKVDADLAVDTTKKKLKDLVIKATTKGGKTVSYNPVERGLGQLKELYTKIGDDVAAKNIQETLNIAKKDGLTNLEVNDIARTYGQEFGEKAFSKIGEPITSVNAQLYENTRKSLKALARSGIKGAEAKVADLTTSSLYRVQGLVKKSVEAVNKLEQKLQGRGLLEKIGHNVTKYGDVLTGGTLRGLVGGLLPRGVGNKVMNAIDIEKQLESNLKIIQEAIKSGTDNDLINILKKSNLTKGEIPKTTVNISKLISHEGAPDLKTVAQYKADILAGKKIEPLKVIDEGGGKFGIEDGKHRFQAYKELGYKEVPVLKKANRKLNKTKK